MIERLISFAVLLQTFELCFIEPWPWAIVESEIPKLLKPLLKSYRWVLMVGAAAAFVTLLYPTPWGLGLELFATWVVAMRWRGTFNGGSDCMTVQILLATLLASVRKDLQIACLIYIAVQISLSYFVAGVAKLREREWRSGEALPKFLKSKKQKLVALSWLTIEFECLFPLGLLHPAVCMSLLLAGFVFHLANFYYFGLNRFVFVWMAGYPALFFASLYLHS